jgi:hypothetical protein
MVDSEKVLSLIENWRPKKFQKEQKYKDDLSAYLNHELNRWEVPVPEANIPVNRVVGKGLCDIVINQKIGIELRKDLATNKQVSTLCGELNNYKRAYEEVIIVLLGNSNPRTVEQVRNDVHIRTRVFELPHPIL